MNTDKLMEVHSTSRHNKNLKNVPSFVPFKLLNEKQAQSNHSQSLDKLNSRGGLGVLEILDIIHNRKWSDRVEIQKEVDELNSIIAKSKEEQKEIIMGRNSALVKSTSDESVKVEITEKDFFDKIYKIINPETAELATDVDLSSGECFRLAIKMCEAKEKEIESGFMCDHL